MRVGIIGLPRAGKTTVFNAVAGITPPYVTEGSRHVYHLYTLKIARNRNGLLRHLNANGVGARIYYPYALHKMKAFARFHKGEALGVTESTVSQLLTLPIHPFLTENEIRYVISSVLRFGRR